MVDIKENNIQDTVIEICVRILKESGPNNPALFDRIIKKLVAAGVNIDLEATKKGRSESPNAVVVFEADGERDYIDLIGDDFIAWGYNGKIEVSLIAECEVYKHYYDPELSRADLADLRFIERAGVKFYDQEDIDRILDKKGAERLAARENLRNLSMVLPDEFLQLCEEVGESPAAILVGFIADLCHLRTSPFITNGSDERMFAEQYFDRCGYRTRMEWKREEGG